MSLPARDLAGLLRPDHWFKNLLAVPGVAAALALFPDDWEGGDLAWRLPLLAAALCLVSSANYAANEILDAERDRHHPFKRDRAMAARRVTARAAWTAYAVVSAAGLAAAAALGPRAGGAVAALWVMGLVYNVPPVRSKEIPHLDVLSESVNNPIRLLAGWWAVLPDGPVPPGSLLLGYWMGGAFLMALKRFSELRDIGDRDVAAAYRSSFASYTEPVLLAATLFYAATGTAFLAAFAVRYRLELLVSVPAAVLAMAVYFLAAFGPDSAVQHPEALWRQPRIVASIALFAVVALTMLFVDVPSLDDWIEPTIPTRPQP